MAKIKNTFLGQYLEDHPRFTRNLFWTMVVMLYVLAIIPDASPPDIHLTDKFEIRLDYLAHAFIYFLICYIFFFFKEKELIVEVKGKHIAYFILFILIGVSTEFIQKLVPNRSFNYIDMIYNSIGVLIGMGYMFYKIRKFRRMDEAKLG